MTAIHERSATELAAAYGSGELSPVAVARALLERIEAWEPRLNAMYRVHREAALEQARAAEARWRAGRPLSALDGVPLTIKENIYTRGDPAPIGTRAHEDAPLQGVDAPAAARVRDAGCVILGKTTMPDFGMLSSGVSSLHGVTRNPWRPACNPSGSSSGAGAAAAAGYAPLHLGTDIGGSVRLPATHCGIFALKPSLGRVPVHPPYMGRVVGPMTRTVADAAALMSVIALPDARDFMSLPHQDLPFSALAEGRRGTEPKRLRIGFLPDMGVGLQVHPEVRAAAESAATALAGAGCHVESVRSFLTEEMLEGMCRFFEARSYNDLMQLPAGKREKVLPFIAEWCSWRAARFSGRDVMQAYTQVMAMREAAVAAIQPYDFLLSPTSPILPYEADLPAPGNDPRHALPHIAFTVPYNMSEQPAASINWSASTDGLPIGVQVIGRRFDDVGVLRLSLLVEQLRPAQRSWPQ
jgi:aspartyl-tRNA(Asn)/glutamyl-tRNA(Gln) amidotransferase subunit A